MIDNTIKTPLRFWNDTRHQTFNRHWCKGERMFKIISTQQRFVPFQIRRTARPNPIQSATLINMDTGATYNMLTNWSTAFEIRTFGTAEIIVFYANVSVNTNMPPIGEYYSVITDGVETWYSEAVSIIDFTDYDCPLLTLTWFHDVPLGEYFYGYRVGSNQIFYRNRIQLECDLGDAQYEYEEEGENDGLDNFNATRKKYRKVFRTEFVAPEHIADAISQIPLHEHIFADTRAQYSGTMNPKEFRVIVQKENNCYSRIFLEMKEDWILVDNCGDSSMTETTINCITDFVTLTADMDSSSLGKLYGFYGFFQMLSVGQRVLIWTNRQAGAGYVATFTGRVGGIAQYTPITFISGRIYYIQTTAAYYYANALGWYIALNFGAIFQLQYIPLIGFTYFMVVRGTLYVPFAANYLVQLQGLTFLSPNVWQNVGSAVNGATFVANGVTVILPNVLMYKKYRLYIYRHNCNFGYSLPYPK